MEKLLEVKNLKKYYPVRKGLFKRTAAYVKAVDGVSFDIFKGETLGLVGESGCGKTTVGKLILRLQKVDGGKVFFEGTSLLDIPRRKLRERRCDIQIIFQDPYGSLNPKMTVYDILSEGIRKYKLLPEEKIEQRVEELLELVGLHRYDAQKYPHEFSGGQRQRIAVARALSFNPKLIVCDEPVSALDVSVQAQVLNLLTELQKSIGVSYLFIAHGMATVKHVSQRVGVMYLGKLVEVAPTDELFDAPLHPYTQALLSSIPVANPEHIKNRIILEGEVPNPINPPSGCRFHPRCRYAADKCRCEEPELREQSPGHWVSCHFAGVGREEAENEGRA